MNKKGSLDNFKGVVITIMVLGILVGAGLLALGGFRDAIGANACALRTDTRVNYNVTNQVCYNTSAYAGVALTDSAAFNGTQGWITASKNLSANAPTEQT